MDYKNYKPIQVIKKSDRAEVLFAAVDGLDVPVIVKRLQGANAEIFRTIAKQKSIHIPRIYYIEEQTDTLCVVEEYIDGNTLDVYLKEEDLTDVQKLSLCVQLCEALEMLHQCETPIIHRDIKPSNILITGDGVLKVIDFDASRQYKAEKNTSDTRLLGTVEYAAPEQFGYAQTDVRSDIYSAGVVFNEFALDKDAIFAKSWKRVVDCCTSFDPENRYKSVAELKRDLLKCIAKAKQPLWKKVMIQGLAVCALLALLVGLGVQQRGEKVQNVTEDSFATPTEQIQESTETLTDEIKPTQEPEHEIVTKPARPIIKPEDVTEFEIPEIRKGYLQENGKYKVSKRLVGEKTEKVGYSCRMLTYNDSLDVSWKLNDNDSIVLKYEKMHGSLVLELPDVFQMKYCNRLVVRAKNEIGDMGIVLYGEDREQLEILYLDKTEGAQEFSFYPKCKETVEYIGFMACDGEMMDYSEFESVIYYVDFYMLNEDSEKVSYQMAELAEHARDRINSVTRNASGDGSISMNYNHVYGELQLVLPELVDMRQCDSVSVIMDTGGEAFAIRFFDEDFKVLNSCYNYSTGSLQEVMLDTPIMSKVYGIGLMLDEFDGAAQKDYNGSEVTVQSINFYGYDGKGK